MKKRIVPFLLVLVTLLSFCSCSKYASVTVNGTKIGKGIYTYFYDRAKSEGSGMSEADIKAEAYHLLSNYVAVNSEFAKRELSLSVAEKTELSETVNNEWQYFSAYYEALGVSKQDYYQLKTSESYYAKLMEYYYSADGDEPVSDEQLKEYFNSNFIAFRTVTGFLTTVDGDNNTVSLSSAERKKITSSFNKMADDINDDKASIEVVASYVDNTTITNELVVINKNSTEYPEGFFEKVFALENDKASSFVIGDYIFAVQKSNINSKEFDLFPKYKADCLKALKGEEFKSIVDDWSKNYKVE